MSSVGENALEEHFKKLHQEGAFDSHGEFRLDLGKELAKLALYQPGKPRLFLRHLFSAAVALEASSFRIESSSECWRFSFDGTSLEFEDLEQILLSTQLPPSDAHCTALRGLALCLTNLRSLGHLRLRLATAHGWLELDRRFLTLKKLADPAIGTRLEVRSLARAERVAQQGVLGYFGKTRLPTLELTSWLQETRLTSMDRWLNGEPLAPELRWGACLVLVRLIGSTPLPAIRCQARVTVDRTHAKDYSLLLAIEPSEGGGQFSILHRGLLFERKDPECLMNTRVLACQDRLRRDLSGEKLVENAPFQDLLEEVRKWLGIGIMEALGKDEPLPALKNLWSQRGQSDNALWGTWKDVPMLALGGWKEATTLGELHWLNQSQGFVHFDASLTSEGTLAVLKQIIPVLASQTPWRPFSPSAGNWWLRLPCNGGEIRYSAEWPPLATHSRLGSLELPSGMELLSEDPDQSKTLETFGKFFCQQLRKNPRPGCPAALRLALWYIDHETSEDLKVEIGKTVELRRTDNRPLQLFRLLEDGNQFFYVLEDEVEQVQASVRPLVLSLAELQLLTAERETFKLWLTPILG